MSKLNVTVVCIICFLVTLFLPCHNLWMGDGYTVRSMIQTQPLSQIIPIKDGGFFISPIPWIGLKLFGAWFANLCGLLFFYFVWKLSQIDKKWVILACLPVIQVFAHYWEIYAPVYALSAGALYFIKEEADLPLLPISFLLLLSHFVVALPIIVLISFYFYKERFFGVGNFILGMAFAYIIFMMTVFVRPNVNFNSLFGYYGLFSSFHLVELLCLFIGLFGWTLFLRDTIKIRFWSLIPAIIAILMTFIIVPHLGMFRDWDLMSLSLLPVTFMLVDGSRKIPIKSIVFASFVTLTFMIFNSSERQSFMRNYMQYSLQYRKEFMNGRVMQVTEYIYQREVLGHK